MSCGGKEDVIDVDSERPEMGRPGGLYKRDIEPQFRATIILPRKTSSNAQEHKESAWIV